MTHQETLKFLIARANATDFKGISRICPYPGTKKAFGSDKVHILVCRGCKFAKAYEWHGGVSCEYKEDK